MARLAGERCEIEMTIGGSPDYWEARIVDLWLRLYFDGKPFCPELWDGSDGVSAKDYAYGNVLDWIDTGLLGELSFLDPIEPSFIGLIAGNLWKKEGDRFEPRFRLMIGYESVQFGAQIGPCLHLSVGRAELEAFREDLRRETLEKVGWAPDEELR